MDKTLFINIGNTNTSFGFSKTDDIQNLIVIKKKTNFLLHEKMDDIFKIVRNELNCDFDKVVISSVVPKFNNEFEKYFKSNKIKFHFISCVDLKKLDLSNLYNPYELGADLLAQMSYVCNFFDEAIVLSLGTTFVIYHIKNWKLSGCIIKPGIEQVKSILLETTSLNNFEIVKTNKILGSNTNEAISISCINDLNTQVKDIIKKMKIKCPILCSGGASNYFKENKWWFIDNLELLGLFMLNKNSKLF